MKIRLDFVTNSSSSSFAVIKVKNKNLLEGIKNTEVFQGIGIDPGWTDSYDDLIDSYSDDENKVRNLKDKEKMIDKLQEYYTEIIKQEYRYEYEDEEIYYEMYSESFINADDEIFNAYAKLLEQEIELHVDKKDLSIIRGHIYRGESANMLEDKYGITCDHEETEETWFDKKGRQQSSKSIDLHYIHNVVPEVLGNKSKIINCISNFIKEYGHSSAASSSLISAYIKALSSQGNSTEEIYDILKKFVTYETIDKVVTGSEHSISILNGQKKKDLRDVKEQYEGELKDGKPHGQGTVYRPDGTIMYEGELKYGKPHGQGTVYRPDGTIMYEGELKDGKPVR